MEKTKHTPGPWSVWKFGESSQGTAVGPAQGGLAVAEVVTVTAHGIMTPRSETEGLANARLIAAAPDLLAALRECITEDGAACLQTGSAVALFRRLQTINAIARAALAKAGGE